MENHKEKLAIFDNYAKEQGYKNWIDLEYNFIAFPCEENDITNHIYNVCDLVQKEALKRASDNVEFWIVCQCQQGGVDKQSILNGENLIH